MIFRKPHKENTKKFIYTENIDYLKTDKKSIWGTEDLLTVKFLQKTQINGAWLNLAAGDGRFNTRLLKKADKVIAADIDKSALSKLWKSTPFLLRKKLYLKVFNIVNKFPFKNKEFDGVFCVGTLHLFPQKTFQKILSEIMRVLNNKGFFIFDFATDIKRIRLDGGKYIVHGEPLYSTKEAKRYLKLLLKNFKFKIYVGDCLPEIVNTGKTTYKYSSNFILVVVKKYDH